MCSDCAPAEQLIDNALKTRGSAHYLNAIYVYYESKLDEDQLDEHNVKLKISECITNNFVDEDVDTLLYKIYDLTREIDLTEKLFNKHGDSAFNRAIYQLLSYLDTDTLLSLSYCSKTINRAVKGYLSKSLNDLLFFRQPITSNFNYWLNFINFFFRQAGELKPIDRTNYQLTGEMLNANRNLFPVTPDAMVSHVYITTDYLKPQFITYCNHTTPQAHSCSPKLKIEGHSKSSSKELTISEFILEYSKRVELKASSPFNKLKLCLLLKEWLECLKEAIEKGNGLCDIKLTEYVVNPKHQLVHRIWIQIFCKWGIETNKEENSKVRDVEVECQHSLYLTIADHFKWSA